MVKHIVMYTFKEGVNKEEAIRIIGDALHPLVGKIPGLLHLEVRLSFSGMDYALYSEFESREALENYAVHPLHESRPSASDTTVSCHGVCSRPRGAR